MEALATTAQAVNNFKKGLNRELTSEQKRGIAEINKLVAIFKKEKTADDEEITNLESMMQTKRSEFEARKKAAFAASEARTAERNRLKQLWEDKITEEKKEQDDNSASTGYDKTRAREFRSVFRRRMRRSKFLVQPKEESEVQI